jgi:hypothetical protein
MNISIVSVFLLALFLPQELSFYVGTVRLEVYRFLLLPLAFLVFRHLANFRTHNFEYALLLYVILSMTSFIVNGDSGGVEAAGVIFLEVLIAYFLGRSVGIQGSEFVISILKRISVLLLLVAPFAVYESLTGLRVLHIAASSVSGVYTPDMVSDDYFRNGVYRASTVFSHPILYSVLTMSIAVLGYHYLKQKSLFLIAYVSALFSSMSSVGFLMVGLQFLVVMLNAVFKRFPFTKKLAAFGALALFLIIEFGSNRGFFTWLAVNSALNPWNAYIRLMQWEHAWDDVLLNPVWGIGFGDWSRPEWLPSSIDAYWLVVMLSNGLPAFIALAVFWFGLAKHLLQSYIKSNSKIFLLMFGSVIAVAFAGTTVHFFDKLPAYIYFLFGIYGGYAIGREKMIKNEVAS